MCQFWIFQINVIIQYVVFHNWLLTLRRLSGFIHVLTYINTSSFYFPILFYCTDIQALCSFTFCWSIHLLMFSYIIFTWWLLWAMMNLYYSCKSFCMDIHSSSLPLFLSFFVILGTESRGCMLGKLTTWAIPPALLLLFGFEIGSHYLCLGYPQICNPPASTP
jgi:hypothetical protein